jgi:hypothetical protein
VAPSQPWPLATGAARCFFHSSCRAHSGPNPQLRVPQPWPALSLTVSAEAEDAEALGRGVATAKGEAAKDPVQRPGVIATMRDT